MNHSKVVCIGEALIDRIINKSGNESINYLGGAPANVVCALSKLNIQSSFIGNLGDDFYGSKFLELFQDLAIDTSVLQVDKKFKTRIVEVCIDKDGDRSFSGFAKNNYDFFADEVLEKSLLENNIASLHKLFTDSKFIVTGTILLASTKSSESIYFLLNYARKFDLKVVIDLNWREVFWVNSNTKNCTNREDQISEIRSFLSFADILKLSKEEAEMFFDNNNPLLISNVLPKSPDVVITNGGYPIKWFINGCEGISDVSYAGKIIDTTGAGDAFLAGLIAQMVYLEKPNKSKIEKAIKFASACGFLTCQGKGAIEPQPVYDRVQEFLNF